MGKSNFPAETVAWFLELSRACVWRNSGCCLTTSSYNRMGTWHCVSLRKQLGPPMDGGCLEEKPSISKFVENYFSYLLSDNTPLG